jgi:hypothetical protein
VSFYVCESHKVHVELLDGDNQPIATFAVPEGFADALKETEAAAKDRPDTAPGALL